MTDEEFANYTAYLGQIDQWPSSRGQESVWGMPPHHAISAYRKLLRWASQRSFESGSTTYESVQRCPLAMALLHQAVGFQVVYADDLPPASLGEHAHPLGDVALEQVFDALARLDDVSNVGSKPLHPITRARIVHDALTKETT